MRLIRVRLGVIAVSFLLVQVGATAVSTLNVCCADSTSTSQKMQCCREGRTDHICPLMNNAESTSSKCRMRACDKGQDHVIPLSGLVGVIVPLAAFVLEPASPTSLDIIASPLRLSPIPPSPPPRA